MAPGNARKPCGGAGVSLAKPAAAGKAILPAGGEAPCRPLPNIRLLAIEEHRGARVLAAQTGRPATSQPTLMARAGEVAGSSERAVEQAAVEQGFWPVM